MSRPGDSSVSRGNMNGMNGYISLTNWTSYQHYKNRRPPWVKFYVDLLHPMNKLNDLPVPTRYLFDRLLLLAAEYENAIPNDPELIANLLRMGSRDVREGLRDLEKGKWISQRKTRRRASTVASKSLSPETEAEREAEAEKETPQTPHVENLSNVVPLDAQAWLANVQQSIGKAI